MSQSEDTELAVSVLRKMCIDMKLENASVLDKYTDAQLAKMYNGIGPDSFPDWLVEVLDNAAPELAPTCMIHDVEWLESDGTKASFKASNDRLRRNGKITAKYMYGFWNIKRYIVKWDARVMAKTCQKFGFGIWVSYATRCFWKRPELRIQAPCNCPMALKILELSDMY